MRADRAQPDDASSQAVRQARHGGVTSAVLPSRRAWASAVTVLLLTAALSAAAPGVASAVPAALDASTNLIGNPGFEVDTSGWQPGTSSTSLTRVAGGHSGGFAAELSNSSAGAQCSIEDEPSRVGVTQSGPYTVSIWVRSDTPGRTFKLRIREYTSTQVGSLSTTVTMTSSWQQVTVVYTPAAPGQSHLDFQGYTSSSPVGVCFQADDVSITVSSADNNPPLAVDDSATTAFNTPLTVTVLANDSDPNNNPLTVTGATVPAHGTAVVNGNNTISYTPGADYSGPDSFTYTISDGRGGTASAVVSITVSPAGNNPPLAVNDSATTAFNTPVTVTVLANDSDPNNDPLTVTGATVPAHGAAVLNGNNTITYTPAAGYSGPDSFTYSISDGRGGTASAAVSITVSPFVSTDQPYDIAVFGDVPYSSSAVTKYDRMIGNINASSAKFSVHVGDIGPGSSSTCTRATVDRETARFDTFTRPLVYTPGDNEWTDCGSARLGQLSYIRSTVFRGTGTRSRGQATLALESQGASGYPENARWRMGPVTFATLHVVGSGDNYSRRSEHDPRRLATIAWLRQTFAQAEARGDRGVVLLAQTDPSFSNPSSTAYRSMYDAVRQEALGFEGQVLYVHGDGHDYKSDRPLAGVDNLRRLEVEGDGKVSYVKVRIDPSSSQLFVVPQPTRF